MLDQPALGTPLANLPRGGASLVCRLWRDYPWCPRAPFQAGFWGDSKKKIALMPLQFGRCLCEAKIVQWHVCRLAHHKVRAEQSTTRMAARLALVAAPGRTACTSLRAASCPISCPFFGWLTCVAKSDVSGKASGCRPRWSASARRPAWKRRCFFFRSVSVALKGGPGH